MENIIIGFAIGAVLMLIILIIQITKNRGRVKAHQAEITRLKAMLSDRMDLESEGLSKLKEELAEVKQQNENMRITIQSHAQKPGRKEVARLQVYQQAVDRLAVSAPGFSAAWQAALKESEGEYDQTLIGLKPFIKKVIPLKNSKVTSPKELEE
jgi:ribosomal protein L29